MPLTERACFIQQFELSPQTVLSIDPHSFVCVNLPTKLAEGYYIVWLALELPLYVSELPVLTTGVLDKSWR